MPPILRFVSLRRREAALALVLGAAAVAWACGPDFPNRYLDAPDELILAAPAAIFAEEIARITAGLEVPQRAQATTAEETLAIECDDLSAALRRAGRTEEAVIAITARYATARTSAAANEEEVDTTIPREFALYLQGARAWRDERREAARVHWSALLALPAEERPFRTTWATYMLGRMSEQEIESSSGGERTAAVESARAWYRRTRADAAMAPVFFDSLGLACASLGREGRVELLAGDLRAALNLYAAQRAAGDPSALNSLRFVAQAAIAAENRAQFAGLARDPVARGVITALFLSRARGVERPGAASPVHRALEEWTATLREIEVGEVPSADRLAWLAYRAGRYAQAEQWLTLAPGETVMAEWLQAKLALRAGDVCAAEALLARVVADGRLAPEPRRLALAELGRTRLALDDQAGALTAWLDGGHWEDAAYLGEQVLTLDELRSYVDAHCPRVERSREDWTEINSRGANPDETRSNLRFLFARRLVRSGQAAIAGDYFEDSLRVPLAAYAESVRAGFDVARPAAERAAAFWRGAQIMRKHGLELWGTELDPDWAISHANFDRGVAAADRVRATAVFGPTALERQRLEQQPAATTRFSYRYRAAELAWWAASLLPNDGDETARILHEAGGWLKARDPHAAEPFYQALVIRCGNTALGRAAADKHWFASDSTLSSAAPAPAAPADD